MTSEEARVASPDEVAVLAHVMMSSLSVVAGRAVTLRRRWDTLDPALRVSWLEDIERSALDATDVLRHLVQGHPTDLAAPDGP